MSTYILVVDDEPDVESLFSQQFRRDIRSGRFIMEFASSAPALRDILHRHAPPVVNGGIAEIERQAKPTESVVNDPERTSAIP